MLLCYLNMILSNAEDKTPVENSIAGMLDFKLTVAFNAMPWLNKLCTVLPRPLGTWEIVPLGNFKKVGEWETYLELGILESLKSFKSHFSFYNCGAFSRDPMLDFSILG